MRSNEISIFGLEFESEDKLQLGGPPFLETLQALVSMSIFRVTNSNSASWIWQQIWIYRPFQIPTESHPTAGQKWPHLQSAIAPHTKKDEKHQILCYSNTWKAGREIKYAIILVICKLVEFREGVNNQQHKTEGPFRWFGVGLFIIVSFGWFNQGWFR